MATPRKVKRRLMSDINVVPYIDVTLVLLIIFMITAPLLQQGVEVDLPDAAANPVSDSDSQDPLILTVDAQGRFFLNIGNRDNKKPLPLDRKTVIKRATAVIRHRKDIPVLVRGDSKVPYEHVVLGMTLLQRAGAKSIGLLTEPPE
ncbi:MAG: protein TolR [Gammaproteobacteria bacterium]|nr:MAG: protein TolR [Gammaproteobacteria bacterium]